MITKEDILARLNKGESIDSIASTLTKILNEAQSEYVKTSKKREDAQRVLDHLHAFIEEYYPTFFEGQKLTVDEFIDCIESAEAVSSTVSALGDKILNNDTLDAISKFLRDNNL